MMECNFKTAVPRIEKAHYVRQEHELRLGLYRAIYCGDMDAAEDAANMMAMLDIDRDVIETARVEVRK